MLSTLREMNSGPNRKSLSNKNSALSEEKIKK